MLCKAYNHLKDNNPNINSTTMGKTIRNCSSRPSTSRVNRERTQKRMTINVCTDSDSWMKRNSAGRKSFSYVNAPHGRACFKNSSEFKRRHSAKANRDRKREREDKFNRFTDNLPEDNQTWYQAEDEDSWNNWTQELEKDSLVYQKELDEESKYADDYALVMKFGSDTVRLPNTFTYSNNYLLTGDCLVRCIGGRWLVLPRDLVMDDLSYLYSDFAWEDYSIGELFVVILPEEPLTEHIQGWFYEF